MDGFVMKLLPLLLLPLLLSGCNSIVYDTIEQFGVAKRDQLVKRVLRARQAQAESKEEFQSALEQFSALINYRGGNLEQTYNRLNAAYERSNSKARAVKDRNNEVESLARALFREWERELDQYSDAGLRSASARQLSETKARYNGLMAAMRRAERTLDPVLVKFRDNVLFLKHNLNAQVVGSLRNELRSVEINTANLIREMNRSIAEADRFIRAMDSGGGGGAAYSSSSSSGIPAARRVGS